MENLKMFRVRLKGFRGADYGDTHFEVFARNESEAWKKACEAVDRKEVELIWLVKAI